MRKLSVVIPVYNVEKTLRKCIDSVLQNGLADDEYEIIIIDDESPDNSIEIAREFELAHSNVRLISQRNKGLGGARNTGISHAVGKYLLFLDSDDYVKPGSLQLIVDYADKAECEIVEFAADLVESDGKISGRVTPAQLRQSMSGVEYFKRHPSINSACNKLYLRSFLADKNLLFREKIFAEDFEFNTRALYFCDRAISTTISASCFVRSENSITRSTNRESREKYVADFIRIMQLVRDFGNEVGDQKEFFEERLTILNVDLFLFMAKNRFSLTEMRKVKKQLISSEVYFVKYPLRHFAKNLLRIIFLRILPLF
ncbi:MAG: glycosyltransferase family 2 protein [Flavobacterium sp.]|nr:MAG: glycosyltransferase family 2 protein [Flavobacterium sp.]